MAGAVRPACDERRGCSGVSEVGPLQTRFAIVMVAIGPAKDSIKRNLSIRPTHLMKPLLYLSVVVVLEMAVYALAFRIWGITGMLFLGAIDFGLLALVQHFRFTSIRP